MLYHFGMENIKYETIDLHDNMDSRKVTTHKILHTNDTPQQVQDNTATVQDRPSKHTCQPENQIRTVTSEVRYTAAASFVDV